MPRFTIERYEEKVQEEKDSFAEERDITKQQKNVFDKDKLQWDTTKITSIQNEWEIIPTFDTTDDMEIEIEIGEMALLFELLDISTIDELIGKEIPIITNKANNDYAKVPVKRAGDDGKFYIIYNTNHNLDKFA